MEYYINLFSPETFEAFSRSDRSVSGFRKNQKKQARKVKPGDRLICYMTRLSRWIGVLEVKSESYWDDSPLFYPDEDPFVIRFKIEAVVWLPRDKTIPIHEEYLWNTLSFTKGQDHKSRKWISKVRGSLTGLEKEDGQFLEKALLFQAKGGTTYPVEEAGYRKLLTRPIRRQDNAVSIAIPEGGEPKVEEAGYRKPLTHPIKRQGRAVSVTIPEGGEPKVEEAGGTHSVRESIRIQARLAQIGQKMGFKIWIPKQDRSRVLSEWSPPDKVLLNSLPLNYDETTLNTVEQIDVIWLRGRSIVRAFEVEHTTAVYSGILRMADLLALQPNMDIKLHLVAPLERRDKVFQEVKRPVFSRLERGPLAEYCTFLSYDSVAELAGLKHLSHLSDSVLEGYTKEAD